MRDDRERTVTQIEIPVRTIVRIVSVFVIIWLLGHLWHLILLGGISLMFAAAADPLVRRLQRLGLKRGGAVAVTMISVTIVLIGLILIMLSPVLTEGQDFLTNLPGQVDRLQRPLKDNPQLFNRLRQAAENASSNTGLITGGVTKVSMSLINLISDTLIVIVFATYILLDGNRIYMRVRALCTTAIPSQAGSINSGCQSRSEWLRDRARTHIAPVRYLRVRCVERCRSPAATLPCSAGRDR